MLSVGNVADDLFYDLVEDEDLDGEPWWAVAKEEGLVSLARVILPLPLHQLNLGL